MTDRHAPGPWLRLRDAVLRQALWVTEPLKLLPYVLAGRVKRAGLQEMSRLVPVSMSTVFAETHTPRQLRALARRCLMQVELVQVHNRRLVRGARAQRVEGLEHINALVRQGSGAVVCAPHLGAFHHVMGELMVRVPRMGVFAAPHLIRTYERDWQYAGRSRGCEVHILPSDGVSSLRRALRLVGDGAPLMIYTDVDNRVGTNTGNDPNSVPVDFLGLPVRMRAGPAFLAQRARVPLVPAATWLERGLFIHVAYGAPIRVEGPEVEDRRRAIQALYDWYEPHVRAHPEQWDGWFHHLLLWRDLGTGSRVSAEDYAREVTRIETLLGSPEGRKARLRVERAHVAVLPLGEQRMIVHGPGRRLLKGSPISCRLLEMGFRSPTLAGLRSQVDQPPEGLGRELARLTLSDLATVGPREQPRRSDSESVTK